MKKILRYVSFYLATVVLALLFLSAGTLIPQQRIDVHVRESANQMVEEGCYPNIADYAPNSQFDNYTDAIILAESKAMNAKDFSSILTNPRFYRSKSSTDRVADLYAYANGEITEPTSYYVRYWMGFRSIIRLLMYIMNYYSLKRYIAFAFFTLVAAVICSIATRVNTKMAMIFAVSIFLVRPYIVALSLQFTCCFFIAMLTMLIVPWFVDKPEKDGIFFMEVGMITMFFDFYTTPIITFGMPCVYLYVLRAKANTQVPHALKSTLTGMISWFVGYAGMWITRLALVSALTDKAGFQNGFHAFSGWMSGVSTGDGRMKAIQAVLDTIYGGKYGMAIIWLAFALILVTWIIAIIRKRVGIPALLRDCSMLVVAVLPFIWFFVASKPTILHAWFQYRSVSLTVWATGAYLLLTAEDDRI